MDTDKSQIGFYTRYQFFICAYPILSVVKILSLALCGNPPP